jgi:hypothetical protein
MKKFFKNITEVYKMTKEMQPKIGLWLALVGLVPFAALLVLAFVTGWFPIFVPLAIFVPLIAMMLVLSRTADKAGFDKIDGQPGASGAVLNTIKFADTSFDEQPVAVNLKTQDLVFRGIGRAGVFFVAEGPKTRVKGMVDKEVAKTKRLLSNVPIHVIYTGNGEEQVTLRELKKVVIKKKIKLTKQETAAVRKRLTALGTMKLPIPKGMDPTKSPRGSRRALRGK